MITIRRLNKRFQRGEQTVYALNEVNLTVNQGEFFVLLGPSGSGKTTLLRCVAGLEKPDAGEVIIGERAVYSDKQGRFVPAEERGLGMVFQSYAIWPHLNVFQNVALPLMKGEAKLPKAQLAQRVDEALRLLQMDTMRDSPATLLSGGQQQRVALARALALNPKVLLMDEPLSNLDARLREEVRTEVWDVVKQLGITALYVTHDQVEAMALADRIAVMSEGSVLQVGPPLELYRRPKSRTVAEFFGSMNWLEGKVGPGGEVQTEIGPLEAELEGNAGGEMILGVRFEDVQIMDGTARGANQVEGQISRRVFLGDSILYEVIVGRKKLCAKTSADLNWQGRVGLQLPKEKLVVFPR